MRLHLSSDCITVNIPEHSSHFLHVSQTLSQKFTKSFWVNETLINFEISHEDKRRKAFLTSLYYTCAFASKTHNAAFLEKLLLASNRPIKLVKKKRQQCSTQKLMASNDPYSLLNADETESMESIRRKYLSLAKAYHPDSIASKDASSVKNCTAKFQKIQEAYTAIKIEKMKKCAA